MISLRDAAQIETAKFHISEDIKNALTGLGWPRFEQAQIIEDGKTLAILLREFDGTISAVRIPVERVAD